MYKYIVLIDFLIFTLLITGCLSPTQPNSLSLPTIEVIYSIDNKKIGWHKTITIKNDGLVTIVEQPSTSQLNRNQKIIAEQLSTPTLQTLKQLINKADLLNFKENYACQSHCITEGLQSSIQFIINNQEKMFDLSRLQEMPSFLDQILNQLAEIETKIAN